MLHIQEIRKNPDGLAFEKKLDLAEELKERNPEILDVQDIVAKGKVQYEDGLYFLDYDLSYTITLTSSRGMEPVELKESYLVNEIFMEEGQAASQELIDQDLVLPIENGEVNIAESVADNILELYWLHTTTGSQGNGIRQVIIQKIKAVFILNLSFGYNILNI